MKLQECSTAVNTQRGSMVGILARYANFRRQEIEYCKNKNTQSDVDKHL